MPLEFDRLPDISRRWIFVIYEALLARVGYVFFVASLGGQDAMPVSLYGGATMSIPSWAWAAFFMGVHIATAVSLLTGRLGWAGSSATMAVIVYAMLGIFAADSPNGMVIQEFSTGVHGPMQILIAYVCFRTRCHERTAV